ncbi:MAG: helix-turn-helix domain-containing protein, partial [Desulfuromonadales bacterium]|nr:helix-turn-helix domain-containing protein [Desulfuromonadales bacterium]
MSKENYTIANTVRKYREEAGWSQQELAERAGLSRTGISAVEAGRLIPSTAAALALAATFSCRVEDLFALAGGEPLVWAWPPAQHSCRYWRALVGSRQLIYPVETSPLGTVAHDGIWDKNRFRDQPSADPVRTLVIACCDPAVGLLAGEYARQTSFRMLVLPRGSRAALELLGKGLVHAAGVHLGSANRLNRNQEVAAKILGYDFQLLRITDWEEGLALASGLAVQGVNALLNGSLRWVGRESGSGARQLLDELSQRKISPEYEARDHRGVAQSVRSGFAQAGVSVRLACEEEGIDFLSVHNKAYELSLLNSSLNDPRIQALIAVVRSAAYRRILSELPGYN